MHLRVVHTIFPLSVSLLAFRFLTVHPFLESSNDTLSKELQTKLESLDKGKTFTHGGTVTYMYCTYVLICMQ